MHSGVCILYQDVEEKCLLVRSPESAFRTSDRIADEVVELTAQTLAVRGDFPERRHFIKVFQKGPKFEAPVFFTE